MPTQTLPGRASDYTLIAAGRLAFHKDGSSHTIGNYDRFLFQDEFYTKGSGKFVGAGAVAATVTPDPLAYARGWNDCLAAVQRGLPVPKT